VIIMDQLKAMLPAIKQHSFWGMCIGILAVSAASWWMSTGALKSEKEAKLSAIKGSFSNVEQIRNQQPKHPNESTSKGMDVLLARFSKEVAEGWQIQYDHQATVLVWPPSFNQEFHDAVNKLRPIEAIPVTSPGQIDIKYELRAPLRTQYRNFIDRDLPILATTIGTTWMATSASISNDGFGPGGGPPGFGGGPGGAAFGDGAARAEVDNSIVLWSPSSQQEIMKTHFGFTAKADLPTTLEVLYAQEDLWVLQSIMDTIKSANADAETRHDAVIKELHFVRVGRSALGLAGKISVVGQTGSQGGPEGMGGGMPGGPGGPPGASPPGMSGSPPPGAGAGGSTPPGVVAGGGGSGPVAPTPGAEGTSAAASTDLADGRYVDEQYKPLPAARLRASLTSRDPKDALLAVAKRMPVRMRFKLDQRRLHRVLAECGNSRLPIEIRQVRINRPPAAASGGGGMADGMGSMADMGGGPGGSAPPGGNFGGPPGAFGGGPPGAEGMGGMFAGGPRQGAGSIGDASVDPNLVEVEVYGIVYIYNPVNKSQLGLAEATTTAMSPPAPSATPASATTPPAGTPPATTGAAAPAAIIPAVGNS
jgi:hypothetical protein